MDLALSRDPEHSFRNASGRNSRVVKDENHEWTDAYNLFPGDVAYVRGASWFIANTVIDLKAVDFIPRALLIWRKQHFVISRGHYHWQHEPCWYAVRKGKTARWCGDRTQSTVWDIDSMQPVGRGTKDDQNTSHSTQKPIECMARPIRNHGDKDDAVYDPFVGSGTTLIAAEQLGRACYAMEVEPKWCDVTVNRWEQLTDSKAQRGQTNGQAGT